MGSQFWYCETICFAPIVKNSIFKFLCAFHAHWDHPSVRRWWHPARLRLLNEHGAEIAKIWQSVVFFFLFLQWAGSVWTWCQCRPTQDHCGRRKMPQHSGGGGTVGRSGWSWSNSPGLIRTWSTPPSPTSSSSSTTRVSTGHWSSTFPSLIFSRWVWFRSEPYNNCHKLVKQARQCFEPANILFLSSFQRFNTIYLICAAILHILDVQWMSF